MAQPNQQAVDDKSFKVLIGGASKTGKKTFFNRFDNLDHTGSTTSLKRKRVDADDNLKRQDPALTGGDVHPLNFVTEDCITHKEGKIRFDCWNIAGKNQFSGFPQNYYNGTSGAIIMFDVTKRSTYKEAITLIRTIRRDCGNIPIVLCGNKVDLLNKHRHVNVAPFGKWLNGNTKYCEISALGNFKLERPFLLLAWMLVSYGISFMVTPPLVPPEVMIDLIAQDRNVQEIYGALDRAHFQAERERALKPVVVRILNRRRNQAPDAPLPEDDDELMSRMKWMLESMTMKW